jgi:hypothetical protein
MDEKDLPVPRNTRPGESSAPEKSQKLMFEPAAEFVELPSHGYLYKNITDDEDVVKKGGVRIRPMTVNEEKILATTRLVKSGQALDMVFQNCIKSRIDPSKMLSSDRVFLMLWLRAISYGNIYKFQMTCTNPACSKRFEYSVDLSQHPIKEMKEGVSEPIEVELPKSKYHVFFRLPRGIDEVEMVKISNQPKKMNDTDDTVVKRLRSTIIKITDQDGKELPEEYFEPFIESLVAMDASTWRNKIESSDAGIEDITGIICPHCETEFDSPIPITENFFRAD